jgi:tetratricopeptide (TPR) repeat protein
MKKTILTIAFFWLAIVSLGYAQPVDALLEEGNKLLYKADVEFDLTSYLKARGLFERALAADKDDYLSSYLLAYTDYKLAVYYMQMKDKQKLENCLDSATKLLKSIIRTNDSNAEAISLLGTVYGIEVVLDPSLGPSKGSQNVALTSEAMEIAPNNPRVVLQKGISKFNTPEFFGGSKDEALDYFKEAILIFERIDNSSTKITWGYLDALAWLGKTYLWLGDYEAAISVYNKALQIEPEFSLVKNSLLPVAEEKITSQ